MTEELLLKYPSKIVWFWNFPIGGFANATFQYLFAKYIEQALGCKIILGGINTSPTILWELYDLPDHRKELASIRNKLSSEKIFLGMDRKSAPRNDLEKIKMHFSYASDDVMLVDGYFQYDSNCLKNDKDYMAIFYKYFSLSHENTTFQRQIRGYQNKINAVYKDKYLITLHVRRGDYLNFELLNNWGGDIYYTMNLDNVLSDLNEYLQCNRITNSIIYVATDDHLFCKNYFTDKGIMYASAEDILGIVDQNDIKGLLVDIACIASAQLVVASNSSLSILSSFLNEKSQVFWRQTSNGKTISFDPWATPILYGLESGI